MLYSKASLEKVYLNSKIPAKYDGLICTFDLDKTYLATNFENLSGLVKIPFESAEEKENVPGAAALVREIRKSMDKRNIARPIYFITGSPDQLKNVILKKFALDGVQIEGILFKDYSKAIRKLKFGRLSKSIGYKLGALLYARTVFPHKANELLFGDDSEYDAAIYSLYSDILQGRLEHYEVLTILKKWKVPDDEINMIDRYLYQLEKTGWKPRAAVEKIFIYIATGSSPEDYLNLTSRIIPIYNYFQAAVILYNLEFISKGSLFRIISDMIHNYDFSISRFARSVEDLLKRSLAGKRQAKKLIKIVTKGNPLALPIRILTDIRTEINSVMINVSKFQLVKPREDEEKRVLDRYLSFVPRRNVDKV